MSRVVVVGATGHIGTYLVPRLVRGGHEVIAMSRGVASPYVQSPEWASVTTVPVEYGTGKAEIEALLHRETRAGGVPAIVLHPGHISGPGWPVINPAGNLDATVWTRLATGQPLALPDHGLGVLNHVHADDVAQAFERALSAPPAAAGASFHVVAAQAMTLRGLAAGVAAWFGREPVLEFVDWAEFGRQAGPEHAEATREHTFRGIAASIDRAGQTLGYAPRFSSLEALYEALTWLVADGQVDVGGQRFALTG